MMKMTLLTANTSWKTVPVLAIYLTYKIFYYKYFIALYTLDLDPVLAEMFKRFLAIKNYHFVCVHFVLIYSKKQRLMWIW